MNQITLKVHSKLDSKTPLNSLSGVFGFLFRVSLFMGFD
ncbi:hypothetical protein VCHENC03_3072 [Vibrio sp. HENC-03]|nr:hypothetical protein VCHENC03_3072 [Vibrio sp. HENC-03]